jgi:hypothetical protein
VPAKTTFTLINNQVDKDAIRAELNSMLWLCYNYLWHLTGTGNAAARAELQTIFDKALQTLTENEKIVFVNKMEKLAENKSLQGNNLSHTFFITLVTTDAPYELTFHYQTLTHFKESDLLLKIAKTSYLHDGLGNLEKAFGTAQFENILFNVEDFLNDAENIKLLTTPRKNKDGKKKPEDTHGAMLLKNLKEKLQIIGNLYFDLLIPKNEVTAKRICIMKIRKATEAYQEYLNNKTNVQTPEFHDVKIKKVKEITDILEKFKETDNLDEAINAIDVIQQKEINRHVFRTHHSGIFANLGHTPKSDQYINCLIKQYQVLAERVRLLTPTNTLSNLLRA